MSNVLNGHDGDGDEALARRLRVPAHVVFRRFGDDTVLLDLASGRYHGLNHTGGRALEALDGRTPLREVADRLTAEFSAPPERVAGDLVALCDALLERGLLEPAPAAS